jgi:hypothetical protein
MEAEAAEVEKSTSESIGQEKPEMRRWLIFVVAVLNVSLLPKGKGTDIGKLQPAELIYIYKEEKGSITITAYVGTDTDVAVPSSIGGIPVTAIGESAFAGTNVKKVSLPNSVTHIDCFAFNSCAALTELIIPSSVSLVDSGAIDNCPRVIVICERGSYAEKYAKSRAIPTVTK